MLSSVTRVAQTLQNRLENSHNAGPQGRVSKAAGLICYLPTLIQVQKV